MAATVYRVLFFVLFAYIMCKFANLKHLSSCGSEKERIEEYNAEG